MHIAFATVEFVTEKGCDGGLANYLEKASRILAEHGHRVTVIVFSEDNKEVEYQKNIKVVRMVKSISEIDFILKFIKNNELRVMLAYCWHSYQLNRKINSIHKKDRIDLVQYCHLGALGLFRNKKIPSVVRMSSFGPTMKLISEANFDPSEGRLEIDLMDKLDIMAMKRADSVFAPSALTARVVKKTVGIDVEVLESPAMGVNTGELEQVPDGLSDKRYFLFFGTLSNIKGVKTLVNAIHQILEQNPQFYFVFVGKDCGVSMEPGVKSPAVKRLKEAAGEYGDRVIYVPPIKDRRHLNAVIYHAELCILPYRRENLPNTCIEAMELGKIVISTYQSGVSQLIKEGHNGFLVGQNDPEALVNKISEVMRLPDDEKKRLSENAKKRIEKMNPDRFYRYMMRYYRKVMQGVKGRTDGKKNL